ncbi:MAG TPA: hypothetical protein VMT04_07505 [Terriglobales bacterium]|nr:hypothetical protein [Terriglobales bacterium]
MQKGLKLLIVLGLVSLFFSCQRMERSDLIGTYKDEYPNKVQILILNEDGTYEQLFTSKTGISFEKYVGKWEFRKNFRPTGFLRHTVILHRKLLIGYDQERLDTAAVDGQHYLDPIFPVFSKKNYFELGADTGIFLIKQ